MTKRLYRSKKERVVAGVLGGIATYFSVDPVIIRLVYVLLACATGFGPGIVVYLVAALIIPEEGMAVPSTPVESDDDTSV